MEEDPTVEFLSHYGVKGMKWGVRRRSGSKPSGGKPANKKPAPPKASDLSDADLRAAVNRMQMERQYNNLTRGQSSPGRRAAQAGAAFVGGIAMNVARNQISNVASQRVGSALSRRAGA